VDSRPSHSNKAVFSNFPGVVWMLPEVQTQTGDWREKLRDVQVVAKNNFGFWSAIQTSNCIHNLTDAHLQV